MFAKSVMSNLASRSPLTVAFVALIDPTVNESNVRLLGNSGTTLTSTLASRFPTTVAFVNADSSAANVFIAPLCAVSSTVASVSATIVDDASSCTAAILASRFPVTLRLSNVRSLTFAKSAMSNFASRSPVTVAFVALSEPTFNESNIRFFTFARSATSISASRLPVTDAFTDVIFSLTSINFDFKVSVAISFAAIAFVTATFSDAISFDANVSVCKDFEIKFPETIVPYTASVPDINIIIQNNKDVNSDRSGVRTHACLHTSELKSDPLDQLGHPVIIAT